VETNEMDNIICSRMKNVMKEKKSKLMKKSTTEEKIKNKKIKMKMNGYVISGEGNFSSSDIYFFDDNINYDMWIKGNDDINEVDDLTDDWDVDYDNNIPSLLEEPDILKTAHIIKKKESIFLYPVLHDLVWL
jgi:hypothetical protein